jgi:hypothetical protein
MIDWSNHEPRFTAAKTPAGMPSATRQDEWRRPTVQRCRKQGQELSKHRPFGNDRGAEIACRMIVEIVEILDDQRLVEAEQRHQLGHALSVMPRSPAISRTGSPGSMRIKVKATIETPMKGRDDHAEPVQEKSKHGGPALPDLRRKKIKPAHPAERAAGRTPAFVIR